MKSFRKIFVFSCIMLVVFLFLPLPTLASDEGKQPKNIEMAQAEPGTTWYLPEGCTGGDFETWVLIQNPGESEAHVTLTYQGAEGSIPGPELTLPPGSRKTVNVADTCPGWWDVSTQITSDQPVNCERSMYWGNRIGGHDSVGYAPKHTEIPETTKVLSGDTISRIVSISSDQGTIVFSGESEELNSLQEGDIICCGVSQATPTGLLRKVTAINRTGGNTIISTGEASLEEAIRRGSLSTSVALTPEMVTSAQPLAAGVDFEITDFSASGIKFSVPINDVVLYDADGDHSTKGDQVKLKGGLSFEPKFDIDLQIDYDPSHFWEPPELKKLSFTTTLSESAQLELVAELDVLDLSKELELAKFTFSPITFTVGPVPVVLVPTLTIKAGASAKVSVTATTSITQEASVTGGLSYAGGIWEPISGFQNQFGFNPPQITAEASAKAYVKPQLSLMLYTLAGPHAGLEGYLMITADPSKDPWWQLLAGIKGDVGVEMKIFSKLIASYSKTIFDKSWVLAQAEPRGLSCGIAYERDGNIFYARIVDGKAQSVDTIIDDGMSYEPSLSPDGQKIAYIRLDPESSDSTYYSELWIYDLSNGSTKRILTEYDVGRFELDESLWDPYGKWIYFNAHNQTVASVGLFKVDPSNNYFVHLCGGLLIDINPKGDEILVLKYKYNESGSGSYQEYLVVDTSGNEKRSLGKLGAGGPWFGFSYDGSGFYSISDDGQHILVYDNDLVIIKEYSIPSDTWYVLWPPFLNGDYFIIGSKSRNILSMNTSDSDIKILIENGEDPSPAPLFR